MAWITGSDLATFLGDDPDVVGAAAATSEYTRRANAACQAIQNYCGRDFDLTTYREWLDGTGERYLNLPQWPIVNLYMVSNDIDDALTVANTSTDATELFCAVQEDTMTLTIYGGANAGSDTLTLSTYASMALLVAAIIALGQNWTATVRTEQDPQAITPTAMTVSASETAYFYVGDSDFWGELEVERDEGILYYPMGWAKGHQNYFVHWQAGYATVDANLTEIALQVAADMWDAGGRGRFLQSEKTGDYSTTLRYADGRSDASIISAYAADLASYKDFRV
jgi:hypothetical protein